MEMSDAMAAMAVNASVHQTMRCGRASAREVRLSHSCVAQSQIRLFGDTLSMKDSRSASLHLDSHERMDALSVLLRASCSDSMCGIPLGATAKVTHGTNQPKQSNET